MEEEEDEKGATDVLEEAENGPDTFHGVLVTDPGADKEDMDTADGEM